MSTGSDAVKVICPRCGRTVPVVAPKPGVAPRCPSCTADLTKALIEQAPQGEELPAGAIIGGCRVLERIGKGSIGIVYKAEQTKLHRTIALRTLYKPLFQNDETYLARVLKQVHLGARLSHPNAVQIFDVGDEGDYCYVVMELVDGESIKSLLARTGRIPAKAALEIAKQAARGLQAAYKLGMVHRNLRPANLLLDKEGNIKVSDFGLVKPGPSKAKLSQSGGKSELLLYASPEEIKGVKTDIRSDVYALGVILFEMLCGGPPFESEKASELAEMHLRDALPPRLWTTPEVPPQAAAVVEKMLAKSPDDRFQTPGDVAQAIQAIQAELAASSRVEAPPDTGVRRTEPAGADAPAVAGPAPPQPIAETPAAERRSSLLPIMAGTVLLLLVLGVGYFLLGPKPRREGDQPVALLSSTTTLRETGPQAAEPDSAPAAKEAYASVIKFVREHPDDYVACMDKLGSFLKHYGSSTEAFKAEEELKRLTSEWETKGKAEVDSRLKRCLAAVKAGEYDRAFEGLGGFPDTLMSDKARESLALAEETILDEIRTQVRKKMDALAEKGQFVEAAKELSVLGGQQRLAALRRELEKELSRRSTARARDLYAEVTALVPELKGAWKPDMEPAKLSAIVKARKILEQIKSWEIPEFTGDVNADLKTLGLLEAAAARRQLQAVEERAPQIIDSALQAARKLDFATAAREFQAAELEYQAAIENLDEQAAAPLRDRLRATELMSEDMKTLAEVQASAPERLKELPGRIVALKGLAGKVEKVEDGKIFVRAGSVLVGKEIGELAFKNLVSLVQKTDLPADERARIALVGDLYLGTLEQAKKTLAAAKGSLPDAARYEAVLKEIESAAERTQREEDSRKLLAEARERVKNGESASVKIVLENLRENFSSTQTYRQSLIEIEELRVEAAVRGAGLWACFRGNPLHTGRSRFNGPSRPVVRWTHKVGGEVLGSPAIGPDETIYVACNDGQVYAILKTGVRKWTAKLAAPTVTSPALGPDGTIYVSAGSVLHAFKKDGKQKWEAKLAGAVHWSSPTVAPDGTILVGGSASTLHAFKPDGKLKWSTNVLAHINPTAAVDLDGTVFVGHEHGVHAFTKEGRPMWEFPTSNWINSSPALGPDGTIYIGCENGNLFAIRRDGKLKWHFLTRKGVNSSPAVAPDGTVYVGSDDTNLYCFTNDGRLKWTFKIECSTGHTSVALGADGTAYVGGSNGTLYAVAADGKKRWVYKVNGGVGSPAIGSNGSLYFGTTQGDIYALGDGE